MTHETNPTIWTGSPELRGSGVTLSKYSFPEDTRKLGGAYSVDQNAELLSRYFLFERLLLRAQAGWLMGTPEFEVKVEYGRHINYHAEAAMSLRIRLTELRQSEETTDQFSDTSIEEFFVELISAESPAHFLGGVYGVLLPHLIHAYEQHVNVTDQVADAPTIRILKRILGDYLEMYLWGKEALEAYVNGGYDGSNIVFSQMHLEQLLNSFGGISGASEKSDRPAQLRSNPDKPFVRSFIATRDSRFTTFDHTYEYKIADKGKIKYETEFDETALNLIRSQRDEMDAIETFANVLYEIRDVPFGFDFDIARIIYDETRHTELGHKAMIELGYYPFDLANRLLGIKVRTKMPAEYSLAEINLFGEANIVQEVMRHSREAYAKGDQLNGKLFDYVNADERTHLAKGIKWLKFIFKTDSVQEITQKTKEKAIKRLLDLGIIDHEVALTISHKELAKIIGE
ncbi:MAG: DUF455 family protein [bacterium]